MELSLKEYQIPEKIEFNYQELKKELEEKVSVYSSMVYTDDQIKEAKADKASLNKLKKALNDERIRREKEYMVPFNDFKSKINEIISIIDKPVAVIDKQVKAYEEKQKQDKLDAITDFYNSTEHPEWLHFSQIMNEKWLNASVSMKSVQESIISGLEKVKADLETLSNMPEFGFEATEVYKSSLDINKALAEGQRMAEIARQKAEAEAKKVAEEVAKNINLPETDCEPKTIEFPKYDPKQWVKFQALMTVEQAMELKKFFEDRNIEFKAV